MKYHGGITEYDDSIVGSLQGLSYAGMELLRLLSNLNNFMSWILTSYDVLFWISSLGLVLRIRKSNSNNDAILFELTVNLLQRYQGSNN